MEDVANEMLLALQPERKFSGKTRQMKRENFPNSANKCYRCCCCQLLSLTKWLIDLLMNLTSHTAAPTISLKKKKTRGGGGVEWAWKTRLLLVYHADKNGGLDQLLFYCVLPFPLSGDWVERNLFNELLFRSLITVTLKYICLKIHSSFFGTITVHKGISAFLTI